MTSEVLRDVMANVSDVMASPGADYEADVDYGDVPRSMFKFAKYMSVYIQPFIFGFGLLGNLLSFVIFLSKSMRKISSNLYLAGMWSIKLTLFSIMVWLPPNMGKLNSCRYFHYVCGI